jgi:hypothetical protein
MADTNMIVKDGNGANQNLVVYADGSGNFHAESIPHDGTNRMSTLYDADTGAGAEYVLGFSLRVSASGGSVEAKGQKAMASSIPVAIASDQAAVPVSQSGSWTVSGSGTFTVSGTITANAGTGSFNDDSIQSTGVAVGSKVSVVGGQQPSNANQVAALTLSNTGGLRVDIIAIDAALAPGTNVIGAVLQAGSSTPWQDNVTQWNGNTVDTNSGSKSAGTLRIVLATDQPQLSNKLLVTPDSVALPAHQSTNVDQWNGTTVDTNSGNKSAGTLRVVLATDQPANSNNLNVAVNAALPAGSNTIGNVVEVPATSGGCSIYRNLDTNATGTNVKGSAGQVYGWYICNNATAARFVKLYDKATAPTVGTDTPVMTLEIPASSAANVSFPFGIAFTNGIGIGATTGVADNNSGAPSSNDVVTNLLYK